MPATVDSEHSWGKLLAAGGAAAALAGSYLLYRRMAKASEPKVQAVHDMETIDIEVFLNDPQSPEAQAECRKVCACLERCGAIVVRDPRAQEANNARFLDMMERYYGQPEAKTKQDVRADVHYQVGVTPAFVEQPRCATDPKCLDKIDLMPEAIRPHKPKGKDPKWRFFWAIGDRPNASETKFPDLNADPVIPEGFPEWKDNMDGWGSSMLQSSKTVAKMMAIGWGMEPETFTKMMNKAPHILGPTGSDLSKHDKNHDILAGYHNDLNFLTIHGKSRFPGLYIWLKDGSRLAVKVPEGCLLMQAGMQLEHLTGGDVIAGFHEVVVNERTLDVIEQRKAANKTLWRVSSTLFSQIASDQLLQPIGKFANAPRAKNFPPMLTGHQVQRELEAIALQK